MVEMEAERFNCRVDRDAQGLLVPDATSRKTPEDNAIRTWWLVRSLIKFV